MSGLVSLARRRAAKDETLWNALCRGRFVINTSNASLVSVINSYELFSCSLRQPSPLAHSFRVVGRAVTWPDVTWRETNEESMMMMYSSLWIMSHAACQLRPSDHHFLFLFLLLCERRYKQITLPRKTNWKLKYWSWRSQWGVTSSWPSDRIVGLRIVLWRRARCYRSANQYFTNGPSAACCLGCTANLAIFECMKWMFQETAISARHRPKPEFPKARLLSDRVKNCSICVAIGVTLSTDGLSSCLSGSIHVTFYGRLQCLVWGRQTGTVWLATN